jgi:hypothetical protein
MEQKENSLPSQEIDQIEIAKKAWEFCKQQPMVLVIGGVLLTAVGWILKIQTNKTTTTIRK